MMTRDTLGASNPQRGFTLLELLVSMTVMSLLTATIVFGWRIAASSWERADEHLQRSRTVLEANRVLEEQLASMLPYQAMTEATGPEWFFQGEPRSMRFVSRYSLSERAASGLYRIEYEIVEQSDGTRQLLMNESPIRSRDELGALITGSEMSEEGRTLTFVPFARTSNSMVLMDGLQDVRFEYFQPPRGEAWGRWRQRWSPAGGELPTSVAIRVVNSNGGGDVTPVSVVASVRHFSSAPYPKPR